MAAIAVPFATVAKSRALAGAVTEAAGPPEVVVAPPASKKTVAGRARRFTRTVTAPAAE